LGITMKNLLTLVTLLLISAGAVADPDETVVREMAHQTNLTPDEIRENYNACDSGVTLRMKICGSYHYFVEDVRLNRLYKQALASARKAGSDASLIKSQRAWLAYRDTTCSYEGQINAGGGTAEGLYVLSCNEELTKARANWVEEQLKVMSQ
jgi:uncharacterized protein YecT (DUF1311 family)